MIEYYYYRLNRSIEPSLDCQTKRKTFQNE